MKTKEFCNFCASPLEREFLEGKERQVCRNCGQVYYENPLPAASVIISNERRELLLVKRAREPSKNMWCFPVGFAESGEIIEAAALRELKEETGVDGRIIQMVDVCSDRTDLYGDLLIVTFEAEKIGGTERAGDDAEDLGYFPVANLPKLAFESQGQALHKFVELKRDVWKMSDSFQKLVEESGEPAMASGLLSDELIHVMEGAASQIVALWISDVSTNPSTKGYHRIDQEDLAARGLYIIEQLGSWLKGGKSEGEVERFYIELGRQRRRERIAVEEVTSAMSILKKHIFRYTSGTGVWNRPVDMYRVLELGERLIYFFDRAAYYTLMGFGQGEKGEGKKKGE